MSSKKASKTRGASGSEKSGGGGGDSGWGMKLFSAMVAEVAVCLWIGVVAVPGDVLNKQFTTHNLAPGDYGMGFALMMLGTGFIFRHLSWVIFPNITITSLLCGDQMKLDWNTFLWRMLIALASAGGWFAAAGIVHGLHGGNLNRIAALSNIDSFGVIFFYEMLGQTGINLLYLYATNIADQSWKILSMSLFYGVIVARYANLTGGSFNFWRTLSFQAVEGVLDSTVWGAVLLATLLSPLLAVLLRIWVIGRPAWMCAQQAAPIGQEDEEDED